MKGFLNSRAVYVFGYALCLCLLLYVYCFMFIALCLLLYVYDVDKFIALITLLRWRALRKSAELYWVP